MMDTTDTKAMIYRRTRAARVITALSILFLTAGLWMGVASAAQNTTSHRDRDDREDQLAAIKQITRDGAGSSEFRLSYLLRRVDVLESIVDHSRRRDSDYGHYGYK
jgi:hypothetical protein